MVREFPLAVLIVAGGALISACGNAESSGPHPGGFEAEVSGAVEGRISGPGIIRFLPPHEANFGTRPGYLFVADDTGVRDLGVVFSIPAGTESGTYRLVSAHPMDAGTEFEVRVDHSVGNRTDSFEANTEGTLRLESIPKNAESIDGHPIRGSFEFTTEDTGGREVAVSGSFDFHGGDGESSARGASGAARSADAASCFDRAQGAYRDAQRHWHRAIHEAVLDREPELGPLSELNTELQIALAMQAERRLRSLAARSPSEVRLDRGLAELLNPQSWSEADESDLLRRDPDYADTVERITDLRSRVDGHPDWPALRALFQAEIGEDPSIAEARAELDRAGEHFLQEARACRGRPDHAAE